MEKLIKALKKRFPLKAGQLLCVKEGGITMRRWEVDLERGVREISHGPKEVEDVFWDDVQNNLEHDAQCCVAPDERLTPPSHSTSTD